MSPESRDACQWPKWALFAAFVIAFPVPYFMFVIGGVVPMFFIVSLAVKAFLAALLKLKAEAFWILGILLAHVAILGGILYVGAWGVHRFLFRVFPQRYAKFATLALIAALFVLASVFDIYRAPGHNYAPPANIFRFLRIFAP